MNTKTRCTKAMCDTMIAMLAQGMTQEEICSELDISKMTMWNWRSPRSGLYVEEFDKAYTKGLIKQYSWWAKRGRDNIGDGREFNTALFALYMANMFGWKGNKKRDEEDERAARMEDALGLPPWEG